jgi:hypothetical protein
MPQFFAATRIHEALIRLSGEHPKSNAPIFVDGLLRWRCYPPAVSAA